MAPRSTTSVTARSRPRRPSRRAPLCKRFINAATRQRRGGHDGDRQPVPDHDRRGQRLRTLALEVDAASAASDPGVLKAGRAGAVRCQAFTGISRNGSSQSSRSNLISGAPSSKHTSRGSLQIEGKEIHASDELALVIKPGETLGATLKLAPRVGPQAAAFLASQKEGDNGAKILALCRQVGTGASPWSHRYTRYTKPPSGSSVRSDRPLRGDEFMAADVAGGSKGPVRQCRDLFFNLEGHLQPVTVRLAVLG